MVQCNLQVLIHVFLVLKCSCKSADMATRLFCEVRKDGVHVFFSDWFPTKLGHYACDSAGLVLVIMNKPCSFLHSSILYFW